MNPKGWCFFGTPYHPFSIPWKIQEPPKKVMKMPLELESECEIINYSALSQEQRVYVNPSLPWFTQNVYCTCWYPNEPLEFWHVRTCVDGIAFGPWWDIFSRHHLLWICCSRFVDTIYIYITSLYGKICKYDRSKTRWNNVADKQKPAHHAIISKSLWGERERERVPALATVCLRNTFLYWKHFKTWSECK